MTRPRILVVQDWFLPGYKAGGSLRTVANIIERLREDFEFAVLARDRDFAEHAPYPGLEPGWNRLDSCEVLYLAPRQLNPLGVWRAARSKRCDVLYLNNIFATITVIVLLLRRLELLPRLPVVLAPRGSLAPKTLAIKSRKKSLFLWATKRFGLLDGVIWHASTEAEREEIQRLSAAPVEIVRDVGPRPDSLAPDLRPPAKSPGELRLVFLSRVDRKKNLHWAIDLLAEIQGAVVLDAYGSPHDHDYFARCQASIERLPPNVRCRLRGPLAHEQVAATLAGYHFLLLPTLNENYGHVVLEALSVGLPVLLSDQTPWRDLASAGVGYDLPLQDRDRWLRCLAEAVAMNGDEHRRMSDAALALGRRLLDDPGPVEETRQLFRRALAGSGHLGSGA